MEYKIKQCIKNILVTGAGGCIGYHLCSRIIREDIKKRNALGFRQKCDWTKRAISFNRNTEG